MANADEVLEITGYKPGGVCPYALKNEIPIYLDQSLKNYDIVYTAAGNANAVLPITFEKLQEITGGVECQATG